MNIKAEQHIKGSREKIWQVITDIDHAASHISAIEKIEVLEKPSGELKGLKWRETRTLFGKTATEVMWITEAVEKKYYKTRAESHGAIYTTTLTISGSGNDHLLTMEFESKAQNFIGKLLAQIFGLMFKNATKKALVRDLQDIKKAVES